EELAPAAAGLAGAGLGSAVFMTHLLVVGRSLKLLGDDAAEHFQSSLPLRFRKVLPQLLQAQAWRRRQRRWKKRPCRLRGMVVLPELWYDKPGTSRRASKKQKAILPETQMRVDSGQLRVPYVCSFCNLHKGTDLVGRDGSGPRAKLVPLFNPRRH